MHDIPRRLSLRSLLALLALLCVIGRGPGAEEAPAAPEPILAEKIRDHVAFLASDELSGRDSGEPGLEVAAEYIANQFRAFGLEPAGDANTYFQQFTIAFGAAFGRGGGASLVDSQGGETRLLAGVQVVPFGYGEGGPVDAPLAFAGYGVKTGEDEKREGIAYDDYAGLDVKGKAVIVLRFLPRFKSDFIGGRRNPLASLTTKLRLARERGAAAVVFVTPPDPGANAAAADRDILGIAHRASPRQPTLPALVAQPGVADDVLARAGRDLASIVKRIDESLEPQGFDVPGLRLRFDAVPRTCTLRNVVARLHGTGQLAREAIVVGGHYDHIGRFGNQVSQEMLGQIHNGADDNASGTAGVLELARVMAKGGRSPGRSVLFICFSGEELGLFGSKAWLEAPRRFRVRTEAPYYTKGDVLEAGAFGPGTIVESVGGAKVSGARKGFVDMRSVQTGAAGWVDPAVLERISGAEAPGEIAAMINMDMIGHGTGSSPVSLFGADSSPDFQKLVDAVSRGTGIELQTKGKGPSGGGSDHESFVAKGIPSLFLFTGMHKRYNTPDDDTATLDYEGEKRVLEVARSAIRWLAETPVRPVASPGKASVASNPHGRADLGLLVDGDFSGGAKVAKAEPDSPAARAGIAVGDLILAIHDKAIKQASDWDAALEEALGEEEVQVKLARGGKEQVVTVVLPQRRSFGVSFGSVPDYGFSGRGVRFEDIRDGTPAQKAGVKPGDVLLSWNGKEVDDVEQWTALLGRQKPGDEVSIIVKRAGAQVEMKVKLEARK